MGLGCTTVRARVRECHLALRIDEGRFHFVSDGGWSDEDGMARLPRGSQGRQPLHRRWPIEDWEDEACGALQSSDGTWVASAYPAFGLTRISSTDQISSRKIHASIRTLFSGRSSITRGHELRVRRLASSGRGAVRGSLFVYEESNPFPVDPITGSGTSFLLEFLTYRDFGPELRGYVWYVRTRTAGGAEKWKGGGQLYQARQGLVHAQAQFGPHIGAGDTEVQVALGAYDMCNNWCEYGEPDPSCHSHAPLFDQVRVFRVDAVDPQWVINDYRCWQTTSPKRAESARRTTRVATWRWNPAFDESQHSAGRFDGGRRFRPGRARRGRHGRTSGKCGLRLRQSDRSFRNSHSRGKTVLSSNPPITGRTGGEPYTGIPRWPFVAGIAPTGWDAYRMDKTYYRSGSTWKTVANTFCCDLMDLGSGPTGPHYKHANENIAANVGIFQPGDVINYILAAKNTADQWSYMYRTYNGQETGPDEQPG